MTLMALAHGHAWTIPETVLGDNNGDNDDGVVLGAASSSSHAVFGLQLT